MNDVDKHHVLDNKVFSYRTTKEGRVFIYWQKKQVKILKGKEAQRILGLLKGANDREAQLVMAKITGNFKRGNER